MSRLAIAETIGYTPGLAATTCDGCVNALAVGVQTICFTYDKTLAANQSGQKLRVAECLADTRGDLN